MQPMKSLLAGLAAAFLAAPAFGAYFIAGSFQNPTWDPGATPMVDNGNGTYSYDLTGMPADSRYEFKITDGTWNNAWPQSNSWLYTDANGNADVTFWPTPAADGQSPAQNRIGVTPDVGTWTAVGDWQSTPWTNNDPTTAMTAQGNGVYMYAATIANPGTYMYKAVDTGSWDAIGTSDDPSDADSRSVNAGNLHFTTTTPNEVMDLWVDNTHGTIWATEVPEPASLGLIGGVAVMLASRRRQRKA